MVHHTAPNLALAIVRSSVFPLLLLDGNFAVVAVSQSFCDQFNLDPKGMVGANFFTLGHNEWNLPQLRTLLAKTLDGTSALKVYELDLSIPGAATRRLMVQPQAIDQGDEKHNKLLLTVTDITETRKEQRAKERLLAEKEVLLREVQHRIANSLQIIASILMLSARRVQSEETRTHLEAAHGRVMSLAAVQELLAGLNSADVEVRAYLTQLCASLSDSMISDHEKSSIEVNSVSGVVRSDIAVSLGLIVTELVINSLKHAFLSNEGKITVTFHKDGLNWTLSVRDDGVGMPVAPRKAKAGLGTSLVEALANQLNARIEIADAAPGTLVSIIHTEDADREQGLLSGQQAV